MDRVHEVVHGPGPQRLSIDWVHMGGPWTGSTGVVHGPRSMFCIHPDLQLNVCSPRFSRFMGQIFWNYASVCEKDCLNLPF